MPAAKSKKRQAKLDAKPDRPDIRDRMYQPPLVSLPAEFPPPDWLKTYLPKYRKLVLDQGQEGACTGFGLAAVVNYLLFRNSVLNQAKRKSERSKITAPELVSTRMLYHLARRYDEWPGEDYDGSSCRGAMKGWFHHGVCTDTLWPYRDSAGRAIFIRPKKGWDGDATQRPLGAYYRIVTDSIADMQAAINEVGAIYVSSDVHKGWDQVPEKARSLPVIPWKPKTKPDGGHAYALVGYDAHGFIIQNSWGPDWGYYGFALLTYSDWLDNGDDAWVAVMGAPIAATSPTVMLSSSWTVSASMAPLAQGLANGATESLVATPPRADTWSINTAVAHSLIIGNDGLPDQVTIDDENVAAAVERVCHEFPKQWLGGRKKDERHIAIYVHGGLNSLAAGLNRTKIMGPWFEENGVYPIFGVWQSGYWDSIVNIVSDIRNSLLLGVRDRKMISIVNAISEARDGLIEVAAIAAARPVWSQMKQNAVGASGNAGGGMAQLAKHLAALKAAFSDLQIHLVGHSAGSITLGAFLDELRKHQLAASTVSLYAPACSVEFALRTYLPAAVNKVINPKKVHFDILSDANELNDTVGPSDNVGIYGKSLLYLVSRSLEPSRSTPILGMQAAWDSKFLKKGVFATEHDDKPNRHIVAWQKDWLKIGNEPDYLTEDRVVEALPNRTIKSTHGCFDNDIECVERTIARILGLSASKLPARITSLEGF